MTTMTFPIGSSVLLQGLNKGAQYNDKKGMVRSVIDTSSGRQEVYVFEVNKSMAIKPVNMRYEPRELSSLTVSEMKGVLQTAKKKDGGNAVGEEKEPEDWRGMDKDELREMVAKVSTSPDEIAALVSQSNEPKQAPSSSSSNPSNGASSNFTDQLQQGAERMAQMTPETLLQQAATMKSMGAPAVRSMNPQMAHLSDDQINMAISQMEMMASNPATMKMAADQIKNMSPDDLQREMAGQPQPAASSAPAPSASSNSAATSNINMSQFEEGARQMSSMTPDQLKSQATMLKSMPLDTLRRSNPQMANMTDDQIRFSVSQMEKMAEDPNMMKMANDQMKNMTPEKFESMKQMMGDFSNGGGGTAVGSTGPDAADASTFPNVTDGMDPAKMTEMIMSNPEQLSSMVKTMKQNPDLMKQMLSSHPMFGAKADGKSSSTASQEQIGKAIDQFANMDDAQLEKYLKVMTKVQSFSRPFVNAWGGTKAKLGVSSKTLIIIINAIVLAALFLFVRWVRGSAGGENAPTNSLIQDEPPELVDGYGEGEF